jgi:hypothetical protein
MTQILAYVFYAFFVIAIFAVIFQSENLKGGRDWRPRGLQMRRKIRGRFQYREMTQDELNAARDDYDARQY